MGRVGAVWWRAKGEGRNGGLIFFALGPGRARATLFARDRRRLEKGARMGASDFVVGEGCCRTPLCLSAE